MKKRLFAAAVSVLLLAQAAAAQKKAGNITVLGDASDLSAGALNQTGGGTYALDGALSPVAYGFPTSVPFALESGFYSRLVSSPAVFGYSGVSTGSYLNDWDAAATPNPAGTTYDLFVSSWAQPDPYMAYYAVGATGNPVETLMPSTSFYNFGYANYMDGDYAPAASTTAVTLAVTPSSGAFTLADAGHNTLNLSFAGFENPPPVYGSAWDQSAPPAFPAGDARYGLASVVYGSHVFVSGGFNGVTFSSSVLVGSIDSSGRLASWQSGGFMPAARYGHQLIAARGRLYLLGGYDSAGAHAEVWSADISTSGALGAWEAETPLKAPMYFHAAALAGNKIYVSGGYNTSNSSVLGSLMYAEVGDAGRLGAWTNAAWDGPAPRYAHTMTFVPGWLYIAGGKDGASVRSEVWAGALDSSGYRTANWIPMPSLPAPRYGHKTLAAANRLYVLGGNNGFSAAAQVFQATVSVNAAPSAWQAYTPLPFPRQFPAAELIGERMYVFGGSDGTSAMGGGAVSELSGTQYQLEVSSDSGFTADLRASAWTSGAAASFDGLLPSVTYYFRAKARNWTGTETAYSAVGSTITYAAVPGTAPWSNTGFDSATAHWFFSGNPPGSSYQVTYSTSADFSPAGSAPALLSSVTLTGLLQNTTYYAKVRALDAFGRSSRFAPLPPVRTGYDPALDVSSPIVTDNQPDFTDWKGTNTFTCAIMFADAPAGTGLNRFEVKAGTAPGGGADTEVAPWTPVATIVGQDPYTQPWTLPQAAWDLLPDGASCYISVRVFDNVNNSTAALDLFTLIKDTTPPAASITYSTAAIWHADYPGDVDHLGFSDRSSGLALVQYSVSANKSFADASVIPWTTIPGLTPGSTSFAPVLSYNFNQLANGVSNYFSFRAVDVAGSTSTFVDAFGIGKNIFGPVTTISSPAAAYLAAFSGITGNALPTKGHAVLGTEVYLQDLASGLYFNNGTFLSGSRAWQDAADVASTFTITFPGLPLLEGRQYRAVARSSDSAGDYSQVYATYTFTYDTQPPSARVISPADGSGANSPTAISGTAADPVSGVSGVEVILERLSDGKWWQNSVSSWNPVPEPLRVGNTSYWSWTFGDYLRDSLANGASYYVSVRAADNSWPVNTGAFEVYGATFTYFDTTPPPKTTALSAAKGPVSGSVLLTWPAAGDNAATGYLLGGSFKIAYSTYAEAQVSTLTAQVTIDTGTLTAGSTQSALVLGLVPSAYYYFTLWTADEVLNWSPASDAAYAAAGDLNTGALTGRVTGAGAQPITGVLVEALGASGAAEGSDYTDTFGNYNIPGLNSAFLTVRAAWTAEDMESSVSKDGVPNGSSAVNFTLSVAYQLAGITGVIPSNFLPRNSAPRTAAARYTTKAVSTASGSPAFVEIYSRGRRIGSAFTDGKGAFDIPNLLPGTYALRVYNGSAYSKMQTVKLAPGQKLAFTPQFDLLDKGSVFAYPNPAKSVVNFHFSTPGTAFEARVQVFDISGRLVKTLSNVSDDTTAAAPGHKIAWDLGRESIAPGVYLYILRVRDASGADEKVVKKFAVLR